MAKTYRPRDSIIQSGTAFTLEADDALIVKHGVVLSSGSASGVRGAPTGTNDITVQGTVVGYEGITTRGSNVKVGVDGLLAGTYGIFDDAHLALENRGAIFGGYQGLAIYGSSKIFNYGTISSGSSRPDGNEATIYLGGTHTHSKIVNLGTIRAPSADSNAITSYDSEVVSDMVMNKGKITGNVHLGGGDDVINTSKGRLDGIIDGDAGNDTLIGSKFRDQIVGGEGDDRLTGGAGSDFFEFLPHAGKDVITDFDAIGAGIHQDYLLLSAGMTYTERSAHHGRDTVLEFGNGDTLTLSQVHASDFSKADVLFVD